MLSSFITSLGLPRPANENICLIPQGTDPVRVLEIVRGYLERIRRKNAHGGCLLSCPQERRHWEEARALEQAILWRYFRQE
jgi:hypothetical protein